MYPSRTPSYPVVPVPVLGQVPDRLSNDSNDSNLVEQTWTPFPRNFQGNKSSGILIAADLQQVKKKRSRTPNQTSTARAYHRSTSMASSKLSPAKRRIKMVTTRIHSHQISSMYCIPKRSKIQVRSCLHILMLDDHGPSIPYCAIPN